MFGSLRPHATRTNVPHNVTYFKEGMPPPPAHEDIDPEEMTDEEILEASSGNIWQPPFESSVDFDSVSRNLGKLQDIPPVSPADFTSFAFYMPKKGGGYTNFSFDERRHLMRPYNSPAKRILLFCGRQVEKSTMIGNRAISRSCLLQDHKTLYVSPSSTQTRTFSIDRLKDPIETSPVLKRWTTSMLMQNVFEKQFINRSKITLRYAFLNPDRTRGIPAKDLLLDEVQDIIADHIPVIEQCTSHFQEESSFLYAGTPKGLDNPLEYYRGTLSTQGEWVVPCDRCGAKSTGRHWNILGEKNIGKKGLICEKCGEIINPMHPDAQWAFAVKRPNREFPFESYRIPQLMVPWVTWDEILLNYRRYPRDKFYNEVLGLSYDSGMRPLTTRQVMECCNPKVTMHPTELERIRKELLGRDIFAGIDWGTGENSYTVLCLGYYEGTKFRIFFIHRFIGEDVDPEPQREKIYSILHAFGVRLAGSDYGGGFDRNDFLVRKMGINRLHKFQYLPRPKKKVSWEPKLRRWMVHRTEIMSDVFNAIKRGQLEFPRWEEFKEPYGQDMLNIFSEYNVTLRMVQYNHRPDRPDDAFHSIVLCFLASMLVHKRPDIIAPMKEYDHMGSVSGNDWGPLDQG